MNREEAKKKFRQAIFDRLAELDRETGGRTSGAELSRRMGTTPQVFNKWQSGKALPDEEHIAGVAREIPGIYKIMEIPPPTSDETLPEIGRRHFFAAFGDPNNEEDKLAVERLWSLPLEERVELVKRAWKERAAVKKEHRARVTDISKRRGEPFP